MKRAIKFAQKYMEKAELPLTAADLTHAFFAGKDFGLSRAWNKVEDSSPSHESANEQIAVVFEVARDTYDIRRIQVYALPDAADTGAFLRNQQAADAVKRLAHLVVQERRNAVDLHNPGGDALL